MRESEFVGQNSEKWRSLEALSDSKVGKVNDLEEMYVSLNDYLSISRTLFPNRSVKVYLNQVAQVLHLRLYPKRKFSLNAVVYYFREAVPSIIYSARKEMILSFFLLLFGVSIGVFSSVKDDDFPAVVLGEGYVNMTKANIEKGNPMAVYEEGRAADGFIYILVNNVKVDLLIFALGLLFSFGSIYILLSNAIMLGAFQYFFYHSYAFKDSVLTIWMHGTIEICTLVLMGGAGIMAGKGWFFPGSYPRGLAYKISALRSLKLLLAVLPMTFIAAFIEAFVTRQTGLSDLLKIVIIAGSLLMIVSYFFLLPYRKRKLFDDPPTSLKPFSFNPDWRGVKTQTQIISASFLWMKQNLNKAFCLAAGLAMFTVLYILFFDPYYLNYSFYKPEIWIFKILKIVKIDHYFQLNQYYFAGIMIGVFCMIQLHVLLSCPIAENLKDKKSKVFLLFGLIAINTLALVPLYFSFGLGILYFLTIELFGWQLVLFLCDKVEVLKLVRAFPRMSLRFLSFIVPLFLMSLALFLLMGSPVINIVVHIILTVVPLPENILHTGEKVLITFAIWTVLLLEFSWLLRALSMFYFSENERILGAALKKELIENNLAD
jgi:uncharacterized membrane protein SpoIIM required for sporulation